MSTSNNSSKNTSDDSLRDQLTRRVIEGLFVLTAALAVYFCIALFSYDAGDPGWSHIGSSLTIANAAGKSGAWFADVLFSVFGYVAFILPMILIYRTWLFFRHRDDFDHSDWAGLLFASIGVFFVLLSLTGLAAINSNPSESTLPFGNGGALGEMLAIEFLSSFGLTGGRLVLFTLFFVGLTIFTDISWLQLIENVGKWVVLKLPALGMKLQSFLHRYTDAKQEKTQIAEVKEQRKVLVQAEKVKQQQRVPPKITLPDAKPVEPSQRVMKE